jgi:hypothetical protein
MCVGCANVGTRLVALGPILCRCVGIKRGAEGMMRGDDWLQAMEKTESKRVVSPQL